MQAGSKKFPQRKAHRDWNQRVAEYAVTHGAFPDRNNHGFQLHHPEGRSKVVTLRNIEKVHIGWWYVIPVSFDYHDIKGTHENNVTHSRDRFVDAYGYQSRMWIEMVRMIKQEDSKLPFGNDIQTAVMECRR